MSPQQADQPTPERIEAAVQLEVGRPLRCILAEMSDVADWIDRTKPQGLLYSSAMPVLREAGKVIDVLLSALSRKEAATAPDLVERLTAHIDGLVKHANAGFAPDIALLREAASALASPPTAPEGDWREEHIELEACMRKLLKPWPSDYVTNDPIGQITMAQAKLVRETIRDLYRAQSAHQQLTKWMETFPPSAPPPPQPQEWREEAERIERWLNGATDEPPTDDGLRALIAKARLGPPPQAGQSSIDFHQQRGVFADIIDEALIAYDGYMADDDYDAQGCLDSIIARMRERKSLYTSRDHDPAVSAPGWRPIESVECHGLDTPERVCFYEQDFYPLSNFSAFAIMWPVSARQGDVRFDTSEAVYHFEKFICRGRVPNRAQREIADEIRRAPSAHEAFKIAERHKSLRRRDWDEIKVGVMKDIIRAKADQHEYVRRKLLATGDRELVENSWRDDFWGWGPNRDGQNMLGKLWMELRAELRDAPPPAENNASSPSEASTGNSGLDEPKSSPPQADTAGLVEAATRLMSNYDGFLTCNDGFSGNHLDAYQHLFKLSQNDWKALRQALANHRAASQGVGG